jgi:hypothetical protein
VVFSLRRQLALIDYAKTYLSYFLPCTKSTTAFRPAFYATLSVFHSCDVNCTVFLNFEVELIEKPSRHINGEEPHGGKQIQCPPSKSEIAFVLSFLMPFFFSPSFIVN